MEMNRFRPGCDLCSVKSSVSVQNSSGDNGPAGGGPAQQARHKWVKEPEQSSCRSEWRCGNWILFVLLMQVNHLLQVADVTDLHCLRTAEGQQLLLDLVCPHGWGVRTDDFHYPPTPSSHQGQVTRRRRRASQDWGGGGRMKQDLRLQRGWRGSSLLQRTILTLYLSLFTSFMSSF